MTTISSTLARVRCTPLHDRVVLEPSVPKEKSEGGVFLPQGAKVDETAPEARVLAVGPGKWEHGGRTPMQVAVGDLVQYSPNAGSGIIVGGQELLIVHERDIYVVLHRDE